jgi:hypothetical protein
MGDVHLHRHVAAGGDAGDGQRRDIGVQRRQLGGKRRRTDEKR